MAEWDAILRRHHPMAGVRRRVVVREQRRVSVHSARHESVDEARHRIALEGRSYGPVGRGQNGAKTNEHVLDGIGVYESSTAVRKSAGISSSAMRVNGPPAECTRHGRLKEGTGQFEGKNRGDWI
jgi:hypothetical protein